MIEMRDEFGLGYPNHEALEKLYKTTSSIYCCVRETVKFFHRRAICDCLKETYYKLKDTTVRTAWCGHCEEVKELKKLLICACGIAQYCSHDCQRLDWPNHKDHCRKIRLRKASIEELELCDYCQDLFFLKEIKQCSGCNAANYCSHQCQRLAWPGHEDMCKVLSNLKKEERITSSATNDNAVIERLVQLNLDEEAPL